MHTSVMDVMAGFDPRAAIFKAADYGIVGAWQTYLPPLVDALQPVLAAHLHQRSPRD